MEWLAAYSRLGSVGLCEASASLCVYHSDRFCHIVCWSRFTFVSSVDAAADYFVVFCLSPTQNCETLDMATGHLTRSVTNTRELWWYENKPGRALQRDMETQNRSCMACAYRLSSVCARYILFDATHMALSPQPPKQNALVWWYTNNVSRYSVRLFCLFCWVI